MLMTVLIRPAAETNPPAKAPAKKKRRPVMKLMITDNHGEQPPVSTDGNAKSAFD